MVLLTSTLLALLLAQTPAHSAPALTALATQVALDRAGFSPGTIDGSAGPSTKKALEAYRNANEGSDPAPVEATTKYVITDGDVAGPFEPNIPAELPEQANLPALPYKTLLEALAERFHATPALLQRLNPGAQFAAGLFQRFGGLLAGPIGLHRALQFALGTNAGESKIMNGSHVIAAVRQNLFK